MNKTIAFILLVSMISITACSKKSNNHPSAGSWTFKSQKSYGSTTATGNTLSTTNAFNSNSVDYSILYCSFSSSLPVSPGIYHVVKSGNFQASDQVIISLSTYGSNSTTYNSTGAQGNDSVSLTVANGKISIKGGSIMLSNGSDSSLLDLDIHQDN